MNTKTSCAVLVIFAIFTMLTACSTNETAHNYNWSIAVTDDAEIFSPIPKSEEEELIWNALFPFWGFEKSFGPEEILKNSDISRWIETTFSVLKNNGLSEKYKSKINNEFFYIVPFEVFENYFTKIFPYIEFEESAKSTAYYFADLQAICCPVESMSYFQFPAVGGTFISDVKEINNQIIITACMVFPNSLPDGEITKEKIYSSCNYSEATLVVEFSDLGWKYISYDYKLVENDY